MPTVGVIAAMPAEMRALAPALRTTGNWCAVRSGIGQQAAERAARRLARQGVSTLVSWGCAGGLDGQLAPGTLVIADAVVGTDGVVLSADAQQCEQLCRHIPASLHWRRGTLAQTDTVLVDPQAKRALAHKTSALAADMESAAIARVAHAAGVGFVGVRAIADPQSQRLPRVLQAGRPQAGWATTVLNPVEWPRLLRLRSNYRSACKSLNVLALSAAPAAVSAAPAGNGRVVAAGSQP